MSNKQKLIARIKERLAAEISNSNPLKYLKEIEPDAYYDVLISTLYLYTRPKKGTRNKSIILVELICAIGHQVRGTLKQKRDSSLAAKTGAFLLYTFEEQEMIKLAVGASENGHQAFIVLVLDDDRISKLWSSIESGRIEKLPSLTPWAAWTSSRHSTAKMPMVKTNQKSVLTALTSESHPLLFECLNKAQAVGWRINRSVYDLHSWALRNKTDAFADIWEQSNPDAKATKLREAKAIGDIAKRMLTHTFYHLYTYDFRGRKYPTTAYLHEQGSDLARGLLFRADKKRIGKDGFFWLMVGIASNWAGTSGRADGAKTDKIPLRDRFQWAVDNEEILLSYASKPKLNQGWMQADSPWQFIAACFELKRFRDWQTQFFDEPVEISIIDSLLASIGVDPYDYESHLEVYIDGSNNGSQHLTALTLDEVTAPHVNLVPLDMPGDLYKYVGDHVWARLQRQVDALPAELRERCEVFIDNIIELKKRIQQAEPKSDLRAELVEKIRKLKADSADIIPHTAPIFWCRITDSKHKRKVVKR